MYFHHMFIVKVYLVQGKLNNPFFCIETGQNRAKLVQIIEFKQWRYPQNMNNFGIWVSFLQSRWFYSRNSRFPLSLNVNFCGHKRPVFELRFDTVRSSQLFVWDKIIKFFFGSFQIFILRIFSRFLKFKKILQSCNFFF